MTAARWFVRLRAGVTTLASVALGLVVPLALLLHAYQAVQGMDTRHPQRADEIFRQLPSQVQKFASANDYAFATTVYLESSNEYVMESKLRTKQVVVTIGFAVMSLGLALLLLGIDGGGFEGEVAGTGPATIKLKAVSSGITVFLLGAALSGGGAFISNAYGTVGGPSYVSESDGAGPPRDDGLRAQLDLCVRADPTDAARQDECLATIARSQLEKASHE